MAEFRNGESKLAVLVWIKCPYPVIAAGLKGALEGQVRVHLGPSLPIHEVPSCAIYVMDDAEDFPKSIEHIQEVDPDLPILIFDVHMDLLLARSALQMGARGFIHAGMQPDQIAHAVRAAMEGKIAVPRKLLEHMALNGGPVDLNVLTSRQREILELITEGLSNAQIAERLYLSESTVKQHLRVSYKMLGVKNRKEATKFIRTKSRALLAPKSDHVRPPTLPS